VDRGVFRQRLLNRDQKNHQQRYHNRRQNERQLGPGRRLKFVFEKLA